MKRRQPETVADAVLATARDGRTTETRDGRRQAALASRAAMVAAAVAAASVMPRSVAVVVVVVVDVGGGGPEETAPAPVVRQLSATYKRVRIVFFEAGVFIHLFVCIIAAKVFFGTSHDDVISTITITL